MALLEPASSGAVDVFGAQVHETITFFLLCAGLLLLLSAWVKSALTCQALPRALAFLRRMGRRLAASCQEAAGEEEVDLLVRKRILELKVSHFSFFLSILAGLDGLIGAFVVWGIVNRATTDISPLMLLVFAATQVYLSVLAWFQRGVSVRTVDLHYFLNMTSCALTVSPAARPTILLILTQTAVVVAMNCARGTMRSHWRLPVFGACNLFFAICASLSVLREDTAYFAPFWFAIELLGMPLLACALPVLEAQLHTAMRQGLQLEEKKELYNAACALLDGCCEVVVELDSERRFSSPEPALNSWLMLGGSSLQGRSLDDFVAGDEEKRELAKRFGRKRGQSAEIMQLSFRDGWNNFVRAELLWFYFRRLDGAQRCILGIRDLSRGPQDDFPVGARAGMSGEAVAVVDCEQPGYPVMSLSPGFLSTVGRLPLGGRLLDHVSRPQKVLLWVQEALNLAHYEVEEGVPKDCAVTFKMPQGKVHTVCNLLAPAGRLDMGKIHLHFTRKLNETGSSSGSSEGQLLGTPRSSPSQLIGHTLSL